MSIGMIPDDSMETAAGQIGETAKKPNRL